MWYKYKLEQTKGVRAVMGAGPALQGACGITRCNFLCPTLWESPGAVCVQPTKSPTSHLFSYLPTHLSGNHLSGNHQVQSVFNRQRSHLLTCSPIHQLIYSPLKCSKCLNPKWQPKYAGVCTLQCLRMPWPTTNFQPWLALVPVRLMRRNQGVHHEEEPRNQEEVPRN